ncbi:MAG: hypothetical protein KKF62_11250, partial [Bacteroidetes bacterium]|nr:hypothetical protein [Bacteroidota bacterium]MBU1800078.1 hypothetical protein [Bacteroidota bacterium]
MKPKYLTILMLLFNVSNIFGVGYSGGAGTSGDPYQIATTADLIELSKTSADWVAGKYFIQTADIDFGADETAVDWDGDGSASWDADDQLGFLPIAKTGPAAGVFKGQYDGGGYKISNLYINRPTYDYIGLFGWIFNGSVIKNVGVENVDITGRSCIGGLVGRATSTGDPGYASIINCYTTGTLTGVPTDMGMMGWMGGNGIGGLLGYNDCDLSGKQNYIQNSYSTADVYDGISAIGGLIGKGVEINISNCYSTGNVTRKATATGVQFGGFCGFVNQYTTITNCYSTGNVYYADAVAPTNKGFIGEDLGHTASYTANFFDSEISNQSTDAIGGATAKTTAQMKTQSTYTDWDFTENTGDWSINLENNDGYPYLQWQTFGPVIEKPTAQPTNLTFSNEVNTTPDPDENNILLGWTVSASASSYIVVRNIGSAPTFDPADGTEYSPGSQTGGTVVYSGTATSATDANVSEGSYYYEIFSFNGSASATNYLTTNPLAGNTIISTDGATTVGNSSGEAASASFPNAGVNITFPDGTTGTDLSASKTSSAPSANFQGNAGVRGMSPLYFTITSTNATPGSYTIVLDFSSLGLTEAKWNRFKIMKRADASSYWKDITGEPHNGTIVSRQTDGVWGKFTISGLSSFSEFGGGEGAYTVTSSADDGANTLRGIINDATVVDGDVIEFDVATMGTNTITLSTPLLIEKNLTLIALGSDNGIILNGNNSTKVLQIGSYMGATRTVTLKNIKISGGNDTENVVGGIDNYGDLTLINCVVSDNLDLGVTSGFGAIGGINSFGDLTLINTTVTNNTGAASNDGTGGIYCYSTLTMKNSILYGNIGESNNIASSLDIVSYNSLFEESLDYLENTDYNYFSVNTDNLFSGNPQFIGSSNDATHPYSISGSSPCLNVGNNTYNAETADIKGTGRKLDASGNTGGTIDIGAYEYDANAPLPVELISFTVVSTSSATEKANVVLNWQTATEVNNYGFEIERCVAQISNLCHNWETIGFVEGHGNSNSPKDYS